MTSKQTRLISFLLAASLFVNTAVLPVQATESTETTIPATSDSSPATEAPTIPEVTAAPTEAPTAAPTEAPTVATEAPTEETVLPTETPSTEPTAETEAPTEETEAPTEETEPMDEAAIRAAQEEGYNRAVAYYRGLTVSTDRDMPLEWWYVMTGKAAMREPDFSQFASAGEAAETVSPLSDWSAYVMFPDYITVSSARDLILLSYVHPSLYAERTITVISGADLEYNLVHPVVLNAGSENEQSLHYSGLGRLDIPYAGTLRFGEGSENTVFQLDSPLFIGLSPVARFLDYTGAPASLHLCSKADTFFDGLFAQHIVGENWMVADWQLILTPSGSEAESGYVLPSLLGVVYGNTNIRIALEDSSALQPSARGYLCATMYGSSSLCITSPLREVAVPLVGSMSEEAEVIDETGTLPPEETEPEETLPEETLPEETLPEETLPQETEPEADLDAQYRDMPLVPGKMPLQWWYYITGRLDQAPAPSTPNAADETLPAEAEATAPAQSGADLSVDYEPALADAAVVPYADVDAVDLQDWSADADGVITLNSSADLISFSYVDAASYQDKTLRFVLIEGGSAIDTTEAVTLGGNALTYQGLGSSAAPFKGKIELPTGSETLSFLMNRAMFNAVATSATIPNLNFQYRAETGSDGLLAQDVYADATPANWSVTLAATDAEDGKTFRLPAVLGTLHEQADVALTVTDQSGMEIFGSGLLCGTMEAESSLTVPSLCQLPTVNSTFETAGGLVGTMKSSAKLNINTSDPLTVNVSSSGNNAGGLVGIMEDGAALTVEAAGLQVLQVTTSTSAGHYAGGLVGIATNPVLALTLGDNAITGTGSGTISGYSAGGLIGKLSVTGAVLPTLTPVRSLRVNSHDGGGLFGELYLASAAPLTLTGANVTSLTLAGTGSDNCVGGLIGWYHYKAGASLTIPKETTVQCRAEADTSNLGGYIGHAGQSQQDADTDVHTLNLSGSAEITGGSCSKLGGYIGVLGKGIAWVSFSDITLTVSPVSCTDYGGLICLVQDYGPMIQVGENVNLEKAQIQGGGSVGGVVGILYSGVLYMTEKPALSATHNRGNANARGWIVGERRNALVCADKWETVFRENVNDTGRWGQVLRLEKFPDLLTFDKEKYTVTVRAANGSDPYQVENLTDFAAVALRLQLNEKGVLKFDGGDIARNATVKLNLTTDISLPGTGLTGLTPDNGYTSGDTPHINGELHAYEMNGNGNTLTLPTESIYTCNQSHNRQGLISDAAALTISNLKVAGGGKVYGVNGNASYLCGLVCSLRGNTKLTNVDSSISWNIVGSLYVGLTSGLLTRLENNSNVTFTSCNWSGAIVDETGTTSCYNGGFMAAISGKTSTVIFENCTLKSCKISKVNAGGNAIVGCLIASANGPAINLNINGLTVEGASVTTKVPNTANSTGGLLGFEWLCGTIGTRDVTIQDSTLDTNTKFGGLVYKASGVWTVTRGAKCGIRFISGNRFNGSSTEAYPSALLVQLGCVAPSESKNTALYLEIGENAYEIPDGSVSLDIGSSNYFDELVGKTLSTEADRYDGVVSIATAGHAPINQNNTCNTYRKQLSTHYQNSLTRYYYNLDLYRNQNKGDTNVLDTPQKMVLWSAASNTPDAVRNVLLGGGDGKTITGALNLDGYSYYPVKWRGETIRDASITFAFETMNNAEANVDNRRLTDETRQHAQMHTGIFTQAGNSSADGTTSTTLSVSNLTLAGTVGGYRGNFGAIIRDQIAGQNAVANMNLNLSGITLDGICVYPTPSAGTVAPLLIRSIGSYTAMSMRGVQTAPGRYASGTSTKIAGSSLIGNVGSDNAHYIQLNFSNIQLAENKNTNCTIFSRALFLESFRYEDSSTCRGVYNFTSGEPYTLGKELSNTASGRNQGLQYWFFQMFEDDDGLVCKQIGSASPSDAFNGYTRYVYQAEDDALIHEIDINLPVYDLTTGCGTYSDPYIISSAGQLTFLSNALNGSTNNGWSVTVSNSVLQTLKFSDQDGHTSGNGAGSETTYLSSGSGSSVSWATEDGSKTAAHSSIISYLQNAYYRIEGEITLRTWNGLGSASTPFRGVITGGTDARVVISVSGATQKFGGLIQFSLGSVVRSLKIDYESAPTITGDVIPSDLASARFFGGVIGWCIGGDSLIEDVSVTYTSKPTFSGAQTRHIAAGGLVGIVGGGSNQAGGGVVFRGTNSGSLDVSLGFYSNPYVGRVLDGYAVSEEQVLDNSDQDYTIPTISASSGQITISGSTVSVSDGAGLWVLSAMENSRYGNAYTSGKSRTGTYDHIGGPMDDGAMQDEAACSESGSYLAQKHASSQALPRTMDLVIAGNCDVSGYGNGFRGIGVTCGPREVSSGTGTGTGTGGSRSYPASCYIRFSSITGGGAVHMQQNRKEYSDGSIRWSCHATGLFPVLLCTNGAVISNLTITGSTNHTYAGGTPLGASDSLLDTEPSRTSSGMLAGNMAAATDGASVTVDQVSASGSVASDFPFAGGLIGAMWDKATSFKDVAFSSCSYTGSNASITSLSVAGSLAGYVKNTGTLNVTNFTGNNISLDASQTTSRQLNGRPRTGVGGLFGYLDGSTLNLNGIGITNLAITTHSTDGGAYVDNGAGGVVGWWRATNNTDSTIRNVTISGKISIENPSILISSGFLLGYVSDYNLDNWSGNGNRFNLTVNTVKIACGENDTATIQGSQAGGLIGLYKSGFEAPYGYLNLSDIHIGGEKSAVTVTAAGSGAGFVSTICLCVVVDAKDVTMQNVSVTGSGKTALLYAFPEDKAAGKMKLYVNNLEALNCSVKGSNKTGLIYGGIDGGSGFEVYGSNILVKETTITGNNGNECGIWGGQNKNNKAVHLVAVSLVDCTFTGITKEFGSGTTDCYAVRANYTGSKENQVGMNPYVPVNPVSPLHLPEIDKITGDGASFATNSTTTTMGQQIAADGGKVYGNVGTATDYFTANAGLLSTFHAAGDNKDVTGIDNFPVLIISASGQKAVTEEIYNYISLLTNQPFDATVWANEVKDFTITTYQWDYESSAFTPQETASISQNNRKELWVTKGCYDNTVGQFTLLDVAYRNPDPAKKDEVVYHLYIPTIVRKMLPFRFWASTDVGTAYWTDAYTNLNTLAIGSHGEKVTALLTFEYDRSIADWQDAIENGDNLLWDFDKTILLRFLSNDHFPAGTKLALVDRNNQDRAYFKEVGDISQLKFSEFDGWVPDDLCDGLGLEAAEADDGLFVVETAAENATIRIGEVYYRLAESTDASQRYNITVNQTLQQQYYLTIQTPSSCDKVLNFYFEHSNQLTVPEGAQGMPTQREKAGNGQFTRNGDENHVILGDFFTQEMTVTTNTADRLMSSSNRSITATLQSTISFTNDNARQLFSQYGANKNLYQRFDLYLQRYEGESEAQDAFAVGTALDVHYSLNGNEVGAESLTPEGSINAQLIFPKDIAPTLRENNSLTLQADITLLYTDTGITDQFPVGSAEDDKIGILLCANGYLAYSQDALNRSNDPVIRQDSNQRRYYRADYNAANLHYSATGSTMRTRLDQLGLNGLEATGFEIHSAAQYEITKLSAGTQAATLRCTLTLLRKQEDGSYAACSTAFQDEISAVVVGANGSETSFPAKSGATVEFSLSNGIDTSIPIRIPVTLQISSGSVLENSGTNDFYANYKVMLRAELLDKNGNLISGSGAEDYIIYTNARIVSGLVK